MAMAAYTSLLDVAIRVFSKKNSKKGATIISVMAARLVVLHWDISVLLCGQAVTLGGKLCKGAADAEAGVAWLYHIVDVAVLGCLIGVGKQLGVFLLLLSEEGTGVFACFFLSLGFLGTEHCHGTRGTHNGNLGVGPCVVEVGAELLAAHHNVASTIALAEGDGHLGHGCFAVGVEQLGAVQDDGIVLLAGAGEEAGNVHQTDDGDVEGVAEAHETGTLAAGVHIEHAGVAGRLVGNDAYALAVETGEADDDVLGKLGLNLEELTIVGNGCYHLVHVVCHVRVVGQNLVQQVLLAIDANSELLVLGENLRATAQNVTLRTSYRNAKLLFNLADGNGNDVVNGNAVTVNPSSFVQGSNVNGTITLPTTLATGRYNVNLYYYISNASELNALGTAPGQLQVIGNLAKYNEPFTIEDVTNVIDYLLAGTKPGLNINDVTTLIDYLLAGE